MLCRGAAAAAMVLLISVDVISGVWRLCCHSTSCSDITVGGCLGGDKSREKGREKNIEQDRERLAGNHMEKDGERQQNVARGRMPNRAGNRRPCSPRVFCQQFSYINFTEEQCVRRLRFSKDMITDLYHLLQPDLELQTRMAL